MALLLPFHREINRKSHKQITVSKDSCCNEHKLMHAYEFFWIKKIDGIKEANLGNFFFFSFFFFFKEMKKRGESPCNSLLLSTWKQRDNDD